jgi:hypothetical protein
MFIAAAGEAQFFDPFGPLRHLIPRLISHWRESGQRFQRRSDQVIRQPVVTMLAPLFRCNQGCFHQLSKVETGGLGRDVADECELPRGKRPSDQGNQDRRARGLPNQAGDQSNIRAQFHATMLSQQGRNTIPCRSNRVRPFIT